MHAKPQRRAISLPVLSPSSQSTRGAPRRGLARWRAATLILVNLAIVAHVLHWWWSGRSFGRVVFSDSMRTLELGEINPAAILFAVSILVTTLFGRFFCGWLCHMGALQDLCAWILRRLSIRPRLFRARLLGYVPLVLALYMFVWPTFNRLVASPLLASAFPDRAAPPPIPGWTLALSSTDLWEGLPSVWVAIPFLLTCGFATVYFLGARGLCRYGCPYGGLLLTAERAAPVRISVDPARCDQCGLCTKACTGGVRVHDQVRENGVVLDHNCIKTLDCIAACPSRALSLRWVGPVLSRNAAPARYDLTRREELACAAVAVATFFTTRGLYGIIPMLLAATMAVLAAFFAWKAMRLVREPNVRLASLILRKGGRTTGAGRTFLAACVLGAAVLVHSAAVRGAIVLAHQYDDRVAVSMDQALSGVVPPEQAESARRALAWYRFASVPSDGGLALCRSPGVTMRASWMRIVLGRSDLAEASMRREAEDAPTDAIVSALAGFIAQQGRVQEATDVLELYAATRPKFHESRRLQTDLLASTGQFDRAERLHRDALDADARDAEAMLNLARLAAAQGQADEAIALYTRVRAYVPPHEPAHERACLAHAWLLSQLGRPDDALDLLADLARTRPAARDRALETGSAILDAIGRSGDVPLLQSRIGGE